MKRIKAILFGLIALAAVITFTDAATDAAPTPDIFARLSLVQSLDRPQAGAEPFRVDGELLRVDRESLRVDGESLRVDRELLRVDAEFLRVDREFLRVDGEPLRVDGEWFEIINIIV
jgi:hypothetical protein